MVGEEHFLDNAAAVLSDPHLLVRMGDSVYRWRSALPALAARVLYPTVPWERLLSGGIPAAERISTADQPTAPTQEQKETSNVTFRQACCCLMWLLKPRRVLQWSR